jgi:hypothetical protein
MVALLGPLLVLSGFGLYMATNTLLGRFRRIPWEFLGVSALGVIAAVLLAAREPGTAVTVSAAISVVLFGLLLWFFFGYSMYATREDRPRVGDRFPPFRLPTSDGAPFDLASERGKRLLLLFYRGSW